MNVQKCAYYAVKKSIYLNDYLILKIPFINLTFMKEKGFWGFGVFKIQRML